MGMGWYMNHHHYINLTIMVRLKMYTQLKVLFHHYKPGPKSRSIYLTGGEIHYLIDVFLIRIKIEIKKILFVVVRSPEPHSGVSFSRLRVDWIWLLSSDARSLLRLCLHSIVSQSTGGGKSFSFIENFRRIYLCKTIFFLQFSESIGCH